MEPAYSDINGSENYLDRFDESNNCELYDTECRLIKIVIYLTVNNFFGLFIRKIIYARSHVL
jgi:hypothetical protein